MISKKRIGFLFNKNLFVISNANILTSDTLNQSDSASSDSCCSKSAHSQFFSVKPENKRMFKFSKKDWSKMLSTLTGKRLSFKAAFSDSLSLILQSTGI